MTTLANELPFQQERCLGILENAQALGPSGLFLATLLKDSLSKAEKAAASQDIAAMVLACKDLQSYKE